MNEFWKSLFLLLCLILISCVSPSYAAGSVEILRVPGGGIQPQALIDSTGVLHLLYFKGEPKGGDLYYTKKSAGKAEFAPSIRVNSVAGSACAKGTIRGGQLALGRSGQVFVVWNASKTIPDNLHVLLFSRMNKARNAFEKEQNLMNKSVELDGGSTVAADQKGNVFVFLHAFGKGQEEAAGRIYMARSRDDGKSFSESAPVDTPSQGTCACCGMKAMADESGHVYVLYRAAGANTNRDTTLLESSDAGKTFKSKKLDSWNIHACPLTMFTISQAAKKTVMGWESMGKVKFGQPEAGAEPLSLGESSKYPTAAVNQDGDALYSWTEGSSYGQGGNACWQIFDAKQKPISKLATQSGVAAWSFTAAVAAPNGKFLLIY